MPTLQQIKDQIKALDDQRAQLLVAYSKVVQIGTTGFSIRIELDAGTGKPQVLLLKGSQTIPGILDLPLTVLQACVAARKKLDDWISGASADLQL